MYYAVEYSKIFARKQNFCVDLGRGDGLGLVVRTFHRTPRQGSEPAPAVGAAPDIARGFDASFNNTLT